MKLTSDFYEVFHLVDNAWTIKKNGKMFPGYYNSEEAARYSAENLTEQQVNTKLHDIYAYEKQYRFVSLEDIKRIFKKG